MTDQTDPMPEPQWGEEPNPFDGGDSYYPAQPEVGVVPVLNQTPADRQNHVFTISFSPKKEPLVVVRGDTGVEINHRLAELQNAGVYVQLAAAIEALNGSAPPAQYVQRQMGATPMAPQPGAYPAQQQYPVGPPVPSPGPPPFGAPQGGYTPPQPAWGAAAPASGRPAGWYAVKAPFSRKAEFDQLKDGLKAQGLYAGNVKWEAATKTWLVSPTVVQLFASFNPMPA